MKEEYEKLAKKYELPDFDSINKEFEISTIDTRDFLLREIRRKITEKIEIYIKSIEPILQPEASVSDMYECKIFDDKEKKNIYDIFKKMMFLHRFSTETSIDEDDKKTSEFLKKVWVEWPKIKKEFLNIISKMKNSWLNETNVKEKIGYMG